MGANAAKLETGKDQTTPKSLIQQDSISQNKNQEVNQENPRVKQLKALQQMADASPQTEKLRTYQAIASQQATQRKNQIPINNEEHLENIKYLPNNISYIDCDGSYKETLIVPYGFSNSNNYDVKYIHYY
jgi:hypothetical protein